MTDHTLAGELETAAEERPPAEFRPTPFGRGTVHADDARRLAKPEKAPTPKELQEMSQRALRARVASNAAFKESEAANEKLDAARDELIAAMDAWEKGRKLYFDEQARTAGAA